MVQSGSLPLFLSLSLPSLRSLFLPLQGAWRGVLVGARPGPSRPVPMHRLRVTPRPSSPSSVPPPPPSVVPPSARRSLAPFPPPSLPPSFSHLEPILSSPSLLSRLGTHDTRREGGRERGKRGIEREKFAIERGGSLSRGREGGRDRGRDRGREGGRGAGIEGGRGGAQVGGGMPLPLGEGYVLMQPRRPLGTCP